MLVAVNYSSHDRRFFVHLPYFGLPGNSVRFMEIMGPAFYDREEDDLLLRGFFLDIPAWGCYVSEMSGLA